MPAVFEHYEMSPPRLSLWRIRTVDDLTEIMTQMQAALQSQRRRGAGNVGITYYVQRWRDVERFDGGELHLRGEELWYNEYRSAYGNSVDIIPHRLAGFGDALVLNLNIGAGVFLGGLGDADLTTANVPDFFLKPVLHRVDS